MGTGPADVAGVVAAAGGEGGREGGRKGQEGGVVLTTLRGREGRDLGQTLILFSFLKRHASPSRHSISPTVVEEEGEEEEEEEEGGGCCEWRSGTCPRPTTPLC